MPLEGGSVAEPSPEPEPVQRSRGLWERLLDWRDRRLADPAFHRFTTRFPLAWPIVRHESAALFDLCAGFVYAQTLGAMVELDLFRALSEGPRGTADLAREARLPEREMARLLRAGEALRLTRRTRDGAWGLGGLGASVLGTPGLAEMIRHHRIVYDDLSDPVALMRGEAPRTRLNRFWGYATGGDTEAMSPEEAAEYSALMAATQRMISDDIVDAVDLSGVSRLMDVGGGEGRFLIRVAERVAGPKLRLFDLPQVAALAERRFAEAGLGGRADAVGGDFRAGALPEGSDAIALVRVLYDHPDATAEAILARAAAALPSHGRLIVAEPMDGDGGPEARAGAAYFGLYLLAMGGGRARHPRELKAMLERAGFERIRVHRSVKPMLVRVVSARRRA